MLSRTLEGDVLRSFDDIQERVKSKHARGEALRAECEQACGHEALVEKARALEAWVAELEEDRRTLRDDVATPRAFGPTSSWRFRSNASSRTPWLRQAGKPWRLWRFP